jgi:hypothetical protein
MNALCNVFDGCIFVETGVECPEVVGSIGHDKEIGVNNLVVEVVGLQAADLVCLIGLGHLVSERIDLLG